jgi:6-pyruvoyl-tetrahydropterin synthase
MESVLFLQKFTVLDYAFLCPERGIQGDSLDVSVEVTGELDHQGFVMDFGRVKKILKAEVDARFDHKLLVPAGSRLLKERSEKLGTATLRFGSLFYESAVDAVVFLDDERISKELIAQQMAKEILPSLPKTVSKLNFILTDETRVLSEPFFRYTHGLRYHDGNCQRLIHGHRNVIEVLTNGARSDVRERELAALFSDIHFASVDTVENRKELALGMEMRNRDLTMPARISYRSGQGMFTAEFPANQLMMLEQEPSIENLAQMAARILKRRYPAENFSVRAYEGIGKGAVGYA